ncbi:MAG: HEPN domain-containing protein [Chloroflexota bacterium]|nr:HEPN domain-containing protein [Chloroflexota bacterium]
MPYAIPTAAQLAKQWEGVHDGFPNTLNLRMRRALSWIERAEKEADDPDAAFIFYWIAFNAAYAKDKPHASDQPERDLFNDYCHTLLGLDAGRVIYDAL